MCSSWVRDGSRRYLLEARGFPRVAFLRMSTNPLLAVTPVLMNLCLALGAGYISQLSLKLFEDIV